MSFMHELVTQQGLELWHDPLPKPEPSVAVAEVMHRDSAADCRVLLPSWNAADCIYREGLCVLVNLATSPCHGLGPL